jgi:ArsR family transcriptional regulator
MGLQHMPGAESTDDSIFLKELTHAGLITSRSASRFIIYSADISVMNGLIGYLTENCCGGIPCGPVACDAKA